MLVMQLASAASMASSREVLLLLPQLGRGGKKKHTASGSLTGRCRGSLFKSLFKCYTRASSPPPRSSLARIAVW